MRYEDIDRKITHSTSRHLTLALALSVALVGGVGAATAYAEIGGAVLGSGMVIVQGRAKHVQHRDGGIVGEILAKEGQMVKSGELLFRLDDTVAKASLGIVDTQLQQLQAQEARLLVEQAGGSAPIQFPPALLNSTDPRAALVMKGQEQLYVSRRATRDGLKAQLVEQVGQLQDKAVALEAQRSAVAENVELLREQIEDAAHLHKKGLMVDSQLIAIRRENASLLGSMASLAAEIAEARQAISQAKLQLTQVDEQFYESVLVELDQKQTDIAKLQEERIAAVDRLARLSIYAPISGYVHQLELHTIGGVVSPGERLVSIIAADDELIVEAKIAPNDVDQVAANQTARLRLTGLDRRTTPELYAEVMDIAADLTTEPQTGMSYYVARLRIGKEDIEKVGAENLRPGMPVEVFVSTGARSILSYLVKPIVDQVQHAMRES
ncbi:HlyD family type I secretion periplasmic adaptor subunit [Mesorhizobium sp. VNQ89]|uniref:HlyD family type I secretion periplasmic adaptor subunit n=1 Tax=Mesorhizobium quangtriensis TaxID=3157709 RepID=UPI0032B74BB9